MRLLELIRCTCDEYGDVGILSFIGDFNLSGIDWTDWVFCTECEVSQIFYAIIISYSMLTNQADLVPLLSGPHYQYRYICR
jgi:hypothetical protein